MAEKLNIQQKIDEAILFSEAQIMRFPEQYRYTIGEMMLIAAYSVAELAESANRNECKAPILQELDIRNATLKRLVRHGKMAICEDGDMAPRPLIDDEVYSVWMEKINEIGRMIGGWIKSQNTQK